jgi:hypothetical protein
MLRLSIGSIDAKSFGSVFAARCPDGITIKRLMNPFSNSALERAPQKVSGVVAAIIDVAGHQISSVFSPALSFFFINLNERPQAVFSALRMFFSCMPAFFALIFFSIMPNSSHVHSESG